jgi:hypothetical protein
MRNTRLTSPHRVRIASMLQLLSVTLVLAGGVALFASTASASPGFTIAGLSVQPHVGAFGHVPDTGGCDLSTFTGGCKAKTFTFENVGTEAILFSSIGFADNSDLAWGILTAGTDCDLLPIVDGAWSLAPGASCTIAVLFWPSAAGQYKNDLLLTLGSEPIATVPLHGVSA